MRKKFRIIYYINTGYPDFETSLKKAGEYLEHGACALQFDLPSRKPYRETSFIKERMEETFRKYQTYKPFLERLTAFRMQHPDFEMQMVSYEDVLLTIGTVNYIDFCKKNKIRTCRLAGDENFEIARKDFNRAGIDTLTFIDYDMKDKDIEFALKTGRAVMLRNVREGMNPRESLTTWKARIAFLRECGITAPIYATAGMKSADDIKEAQEGGADGAFIGSALMKLWNDEDALWKLFNEMQSICSE